MAVDTLFTSRTIGYLHRDERGRFLFLGYVLDLTPREHDILNFIFESHPTPRSSEDIAKAINGLSSDSVAVFANMINKKSRDIGTRRLILCHRGAGYALNEYM